MLRLLTRDLPTSQMLLMTALAALARCELLVISPGTATASSMESLQECCRALAALRDERSKDGAGLTLLLREPDLEYEQIDRIVSDLAPRFGSDGLRLHEKCEGARAIASAHGIGLHVKSTTDWQLTRADWSGPLGASTHSLEEVDLASQYGLQWVFLSPVFQPTSKPLDARPHLGEEYLLHAQRTYPELGIYALGGISPSAARRLAAAGAHGVAVLGGIFRAGVHTPPQQVTAAASEFLDELERGTPDPPSVTCPTYV